MSVLGKIVDYPSCYNPGLLVPIPRIGSRVDLIKSYGVQESELGNGFDQWTAFEFCWKLKSDHSSLRNWKVAVLNINVPANSVNIVESKSLKLYLHSVSHLEFCNSAEVVDLLKADLSMLVKAQVEITLLGPDSWSDIMPTESKGLELETGKGDAVVGDNLVFYSNLLRSKCPVTGQPDWGKIYFAFTFSQPFLAEDVSEVLSSELVSLMDHQGFHEEIVERYYCICRNQFTEVFDLTVGARFTRRGGIDINPVRYLKKNLLLTGRDVRQ